MSSGIYAVTNTVNGKSYVGSSVNIKVRLRQHRRHLNAGKHANRHLQYAWNKYGEASFSFDALEFCSRDAATLIEREQWHMDARQSFIHANGYNIRRKAESNADIILDLTPEQRKVRSERGKKAMEPYEAPVVQYSLSRRAINTFNSISQAARALGVTQEAISIACKHGGVIKQCFWGFKDAPLVKKQKKQSAPLDASAFARVQEYAKLSHFNRTNA